MFLAGTGIIYLHLPVYLCTAGGRGLLSRRTCAVRFSNRPIGVYQSLLLLYIPCFILIIPCSVVFVSYTRSAAALLYSRFKGVTHIGRHLQIGVTYTAEPHIFAQL